MRRLLHVRITFGAALAAAHSFLNTDGPRDSFRGNAFAIVASKPSNSSVRWVRALGAQNHIESITIKITFYDCLDIRIADASALAAVHSYMSTGRGIFPRGDAFA